MTVTVARLAGPRAADAAAASRLGALGWALKALRRELLDFRFMYDVHAVPAAVRAGALAFHIRSDRLFFDAMRLDADGIPVHWSRTFQSYNPVYIAWYGLAALQRAEDGRQPDGRDVFLTQVAWLEAHADRRAPDDVRWPLTFDWVEGRAALRAPWPCSMAQGLAMSALVRAWRLTGRAELLDLARGATGVLRLGLDEGGLREPSATGATFEEYPARPLPRVLDGFLFSLLGLYDLANETGDGRARALLDEGLRGLHDLLPAWDYRGRWSWYGSHGYLCPPHYNRLNAVLLRCLARATGEATLERVAARWDPERRTALQRAEIYLAFVLTKQLARVRFRLGR